MKRITPRTCLWPLTGSLIASFALSLGLTFRSDHHCYAGTCGEWLFPLQARLHVVVWYCWLSLSVTFLALRAFHPSIRRGLHKQIYANQLPVVRKSLTISGVLVVFWVLSLYGILVGIWWLRLQEYFVTRGEQGGMRNGNRRVALVALTGHVCDVTMGMVLLPVARNSALSSFFRLSATTTYAFHMIQAYVLFALVVIHGLLYASWVAAYNHARNLTRSPLAFPVLNPTYLYHEVWPGNKSSLGIWRASLIFTGIVTTLIMLAVFITTFPVIRRKHFNLFYFTHLLMIIAVVVICLHASTMFYCTAPGLAMWILDWGMRIYELSGKMDSTLVAVGKGWFCLTVPLPRERLKGCACHSPLAHFHIHHSESSIREIHPFTTITHLASQKLSSSDTDKNTMIQFLFRKSKVSRSSITQNSREKRRKRQWTNKLAELIDEGTIDLSPPSENPEASDVQRQRLSAQYQTTLRLEGPYFTAANPASYNTVICLVAGTGVTGAIAIAAAFRQQPMIDALEPETTMFGHEKIHGAPLERNFTISSFLAPAGAGSIWKRCVVVWSVQEDEYIDLPFWHVDTTPGLEVRPFLTGKGRGRVNMEDTIDSIKDTGGRIWVYISGPSSFIEAGEKACRRSGVGFFGARWA